MPFGSRLTSPMKNVADSLAHPHGFVAVTSLMMRLLSFSSSTIAGAQLPSAKSGTPNPKATIQSVDTGDYGAAATFGYKDVKSGRHQNPLNPIPDRPLKGVKPKPTQPSQRLTGKQFDLGAATTSVAATGEKNHVSHSKCPSGVTPGGGTNKDFLESLKLGFDHKGEKNLQGSRGKKAEGDQAGHRPPEQPSPTLQDADEIFKKMKETGLIPSAVAMLDGLCKDGLFQEAMKLFGLMREKGTIPEVVIYTALVEGFCKANKFDDAKRIFRKMQNKGVFPNAFSFMVLIQGLYNGNRLEDALDFCVEMLDAGHSPNFTTFTGLVNAYCQEKGVEEAQTIITSLRQKGFFYDEKAVREHLDKKGPFLPVVWKAILGKKSSH